VNANEPATVKRRTSATRLPTHRAAAVITEIFAPSVVIVVLSLSMAWGATGQHLGQTLLWALVVATFSAGLPMVFIVRGARAGRYDTHHINNREARFVPVLVCLGSTAIGLTILLLGNAPQALVAMSLVMLAVLVVTGAITSRWKISLHTAVAAGGVAMLALLYNGYALLLLAAVGLIA
jgi:hypothetical protein